MLREVVILNHFRIRDRFVGQDGGQTFGQQVVPASNPIPLLALVLQAIDVQSDRRSTGTKYRGEGGVRGITSQCGIIALRNRMQRGQKGMYDCVEVLMTNGGQDFQANALKLNLPRTDIMRATIDRYIMAARD